MRSYGTDDTKQSRPVVLLAPTGIIAVETPISCQFMQAGAGYDKSLLLLEGECTLNDCVLEGCADDLPAAADHGWRSPAARSVRAHRDGWDMEEARLNLGKRDWTRVMVRGRGDVQWMLAQKR
jgi:hypothetical protein